MNDIYMKFISPLWAANMTTMYNNMQSTLHVTEDRQQQKKTTKYKTKVT